MRYRGTPHCTPGWLLYLCGVLIATFTAANTWADPKAWNQKQVTLLAGEFYDSAQYLREQCRTAPRPRRTSEFLNDHARLLYDVRLIRSEGAHLHSELQAGKEAVETRPVYEQLTRLMARARRNVDVIRPARQVTKALDDAERTLQRLAPYYAEG